MTLDLEALAVARADEQLDAGAWKRKERFEHLPAPLPPLEFKDAACDGVCAVRGCYRKARVKRMCEKHYRRARRAP